MLKTFIIISLLVTVGLLIEKAIHIDYDITGITLALKQDISKFVKALFCKPIERHCFDVTLSNDIKTIAESYSKKGFDIQLSNSGSSDTLCTRPHTITSGNLGTHTTASNQVPRISRFL